MHRFADALRSVATTLWVGGMWITGYAVAPVLFSVLPDRTLAGAVAGRLFASMAWIGILCAACLLTLGFLRHRAAVLHMPAFRIVVLMLVLVCAGHFGVQPVLADLKGQALPLPVMESDLRERFAFWHGVSAVIYLVQSLLGVALVITAFREKNRSAGGA